MSNELDVRRLIAEVHKRPPLWDVRMAEYKDRTNTPLLWNEIAEVLNVDVEHCKRKWKNLRDAYRAEVRRTERRIDRLKSLGQYDPNHRCTSKWVYFEHMNFINESKRPTYATRGNISIQADADNVNTSPEDEQKPHYYESGFNSLCDIKMETHHTTTDEDDEEDDKLFEEFNAVATPQAARRLSEGFANAAAAAVEFNDAMEENGGTNGGRGTASRCRCDKRTDDQVHFLEDLEREEQQLMQSTRKEITRANSVGHVGDADYNFLVSFLPQMKKMSELQNLQFRAKMSELLFNTMATSSGCATSQPTSSAAYSSGCQAMLSNNMQCQSIQMQPQQQQLQQQPTQQQLPVAPSLPCLTNMSEVSPTPVEECAAVGMLPQEQMMQDTDMSSTSSPATVIAASAANWN